MIPPPPRSTLFPYPTLFRSKKFGGCRATDQCAPPFDEFVNATDPETDRDDEKRLPAFPIQNIEADKKDRKSPRLNSSHLVITYAAFSLKKKIQRHISLFILYNIIK